MAIPSTPTNFYVTQGNGNVFAQWDISAGATTYSVQRSTDGTTYSVLATPAVNYYEDTTAVVGTNYYYKVASTNADGTSGYTDPQNVVPTLGGEMSLAELGTRALQRADRLNSGFITLPELNSMINQSCYELYDLLITAYEDYFKAPDAVFTTVGGQQSYTMPNGAQVFQDNSGSNFVAQPIYKLMGVDLCLNSNNNGWVTVSKFNYIDRNRYIYPNSSGQLYGVFNLQYRWVGTKLELIPIPSAGQIMRILYIPRLPQLLKPWDITTTSISGWLEYVITDVAIKILQKEESDVSVLMAQKMALKERIESSAQNKDQGRPDTISDTRNNWGYGNGGFNGPIGGY